MAQKNFRVYYNEYNTVREEYSENKTRTVSAYTPDAAKQIMRDENTDERIVLHFSKVRLIR